MNISKTRLYRVWDGIKTRTTNPNHIAFKHYGGRGIKMCVRWSESFAAFLADMGPGKPGLTIERIDNSKGYEPGNCVWASFKVQHRNRRDNLLITFDGRTQVLAAWSVELGLKYRTLHARIFDRGWPIDKALTTPKIVPVKPNM